MLDFISYFVIFYYTSPFEKYIVNQQLIPMLITVVNKFPYQMGV